MPIDWPEPFGLVMIEAMACGTPVIAFNRGSVPEVVDDGVTGFIVEDETGALAAIKRLDNCRATVSAASSKHASRLAEWRRTILPPIAAWAWTVAPPCAWSPESKWKPAEATVRAVASQASKFRTPRRRGSAARPRISG